jgi:hypothetical protein
LPEAFPRHASFLSAGSQPAVLARVSHRGNVVHAMADITRVAYLQVDSNASCTIQQASWHFGSSHSTSYYIPCNDGLGAQLYPFAMAIRTYKYSKGKL